MSALEQSGHLLPQCESVKHMWVLAGPLKTWSAERPLLRSGCAWVYSKMPCRSQ